LRLKPYSRFNPSGQDEKPRALHSAVQPLATIGVMASFGYLMGGVAGTLLGLKFKDSAEVGMLSNLLAAALIGATRTTLTEFERKP
jgi:hypothetical protein